VPSGQHRLPVVRADLTLQIRQRGRLARLGPDHRVPHVQGQPHAVLAEYLLPGVQRRRLGVDEHPVEVEDQRAHSHQRRLKGAGMHGVSDS
jgi:hypothetical protein